MDSQTKVRGGTEREGVEGPGGGCCLRYCRGGVRCAHGECGCCKVSGFVDIEEFLNVHAFVNGGRAGVSHGRIVLFPRPDPSCPTKDSLLMPQPPAIFKASMR